MTTRDKDEDGTNKNLTTFSDAELTILRNTWYEVTRTQSNSFGAKLFLRLFELHSQYLPLFGFSSTTNVTGDMEFRNCPKLAAHGANVLYMLTMCFDNLDDHELVDMMLTKLVHSHVRRGIQPSAFDHIVRPFDDVLLGCGQFSPSEMDTLKKAFDTVKNSIQRLYEDVEAGDLFEDDDDSGSIGTASQIDLTII